MTGKALFLTLLIASATAAPAANMPGRSPPGLPDLHKIVGSLESEYLTYSAGRGKRFAVSAQSRADLGSTKLSLLLSQGKRTAGGSTFHGTRLQATLAHDWSSRLSTRTVAGFGSKAPVFVNRELAQDISFKLLDRTIVTAGGSYSRYSGGVNSYGWSLGASQYFKGGLVTYRFSDFLGTGIRNSFSHVVSAKLNDPYGTTQVWLGHGNTMRLVDDFAPPQKGKFTQIELQRSFKIADGISLSVAGRRSWNETTTSKYRGTGFRAGLIFGR